MPAPARITTAVPVAVFGVPADHVAADDDTADEAIIRILAARVRVCVARLPQRERRVVRAHFGLGCEPLSLREIAAELGISPDTAMRLERHALELLRDWV